MRILLASLTFIMALTGAATAAEVRIDPALKSFAQGPQSQSASVVVMMEYSKTNILPRRYDGRAVKFFLMGQTHSAVQDVNGFLKSVGITRADVQVDKVFWINNSFSAKVTPKGLKALASSPRIKKVYMNRQLPIDKPVAVRAVNRQAGNPGAYAFHDIQLDVLMQQMPAITGQGVLVGHIDTGVDGQHPALKDKIAMFYDVVQKKPVPATDSATHGSHTAGTILGGNRTDNRIGVAPGAKLISIGPSLSYDNMLAGMQFLIDPDGDPNTPDNPRLVSNSWNCDGAPDEELFFAAIGAWEAAGILPVFSAGNAGPGAGTITKPHEHPATLAVGATGEPGTVTDFSSRGPGNYKGTQTQKPDLTAPGANIVSSVPGGGYQAMSGTSMAAPHAAGVVALMLQANPKLNPAQIKEILLKSADSVDETGKPSKTKAWNANYGYGKINAFAAVTAAQNYNPQPARPSMNLFDLNTANSNAGFEPLVTDNMTMPRSFEGTTWLTAKDIW